MKAKQWRYAHASSIGSAHLAQRTECQDRLVCRTIETEKDGAVLIAAIADGAGSTTSGGRGAEIACELFAGQAIEFLQTAHASIVSLNEDFGRLWIEFFQTRIAEIARENAKEARDYASTLIGAIVGARGAAFYQVGDGGAVYSADGKAASYRFAVEPVETEYVNVTQFLTDEAAATALRFRYIEEPIEDLILFSDGIYAVAVDYKSNLPHERFLMPMIAPLRTPSAPNDLNEKLEKFLASPKLNEKTDDDKTIILASCKTVNREK